MATTKTRAQGAERPEVVEATDARAGSWGKGLLWVLLVSTAMAVLVMVASWAISGGRDAKPGGPTMVQPPATASRL